MASGSEFMHGLGLDGKSFWILIQKAKSMSCCYKRCNSMEWQLLTSSRHRSSHRAAVLALLPGRPRRICSPVSVPGIPHWKNESGWKCVWSGGWVGQYCILPSGRMRSEGILWVWLSVCLSLLSVVREAVLQELDPLHCPPPCRLFYLQSTLPSCS